jgi:outer membrane protein OmpA-like peptidoglycan-associated protein
MTPVEVAGTTAIGTSRHVLATLKSTGKADLSVFDLPPSMPSDHPYSADRGRHPSVFDHEVPFRLRRADVADVTVPVTLNDVKVELPAIHATGTGEWGEKGDFYFLDDEDNPLALRFRIRTSDVSTSDRAVLQVVKISSQCSASPAGGGALERALLENRRAEVYSIFFSFNSDDIREESEPTLREIADVLARHPDWSVAIEGHTDGVASDAFNLDLSRRRAAAVKNALVGRFGVEGARLTTSGFGRSRPRDTNDTPEGRARNRRVELIRR